MSASASKIVPHLEQLSKVVHFERKDGLDCAKLNTTRLNDSVRSFQHCLKPESESLVQFYMSEDISYSRFDGIETGWHLQELVHWACVGDRFDG